MKVVHSVTTTDYTKDVIIDRHVTTEFIGNKGECINQLPVMCHRLMQAGKVPFTVYETEIVYYKHNADKGILVSEMYAVEPIVDKDENKNTEQEVKKESATKQ